ncbi:MAG: hypothetical protein ABSE66_09950 [Thermoplasmata archaeon]
MCDNETAGTNSSLETTRLAENTPEGEKVVLRLFVYRKADYSLGVRWTAGLDVGYAELARAYREVARDAAGVISVRSAISGGESEKARRRRSGRAKGASA